MLTLITVTLTPSDWLTAAILASHWSGEMMDDVVCQVADWNHNIGLSLSKIKNIYAPFVV